LVKRTASIGELRALSQEGCNDEKFSICARISGEAFRRNQLRPSALIATDDCVRGRTEPLPARASRQTAQLQFHCGTPPPAAVPSKCMRIASIYCFSLPEDNPLFVLLWGWAVLTLRRL
jgi:hypothetical protein